MCYNLYYMLLFTNPIPIYHPFNCYYSSKTYLTTFDACPYDYADIRVTTIVHYYTVLLPYPILYTILLLLLMLMICYRYI